MRKISTILPSRFENSSITSWRSSCARSSALTYSPLIAQTAAGSTTDGTSMYTRLPALSTSGAYASPAAL